MSTATANAVVTPINRLLVANRGEIAVRVMRTARAMGITTVAVFSDADRNALHVASADEAVWIGAAAAAESYLDVQRIVDAAVRSGCDALHPGYGFLSENPLLAKACTDAGIVFVGPPAAAIDAMGDKIRAKATVAASGVPVVPGCTDSGLDDESFIAAILEVGLPVLLKPSAGGGGKGMHLVAEPSALADAIAAARREAKRSFGNDALLAERAVVAPRHIEIQIAADHHGNVVHLGERECSLQRRHQKVIEEAPSPCVTPAVRERMGAQAVAAAAACGYTNVGTVEFIVSAHAPDEFFFIEMNTRLQVEHPVTEMVTGVDIVELQLRIAQGERLPSDLGDQPPRGHAIEARIYAEDPATGFLPTGGTILVLDEPSGPGVRCASGVRCETVVGSDYDPMLAKVIAYGADRAQALRRLDAALGRTTILGVITNIAWLRALLQDPAVSAGELDTELIDRSTLADDLPGPPDDALVAAVVVALGTANPGAIHDDLWQTTDGWRLGGHARQRAQVNAPGRATMLIDVTRRGVGWDVRISPAQPQHAELEYTNLEYTHLEHADIEDAHGSSGQAVAAGAAPVVLADVAVEQCGQRVATTVDGLVRHYDIAVDAAIDAVVDVAGAGETIWLGSGGAAWPIKVRHRWTSAGPHRGGPGDGAVVSPLPGTVLDVRVAVGDAVTVGQVVATVEAMKMEHPLRAAIAGTVATVHVAPGTTVALGQVVVQITAPPQEQPTTP